MVETHVNKLHVIFIILFNCSTSVANVHGSFFSSVGRALSLIPWRGRVGGRAAGGHLSLSFGTRGISPTFGAVLLDAFTVER